METPALELEVKMSLPNEPQPQVDELAAKLYAETRDSVLKIVTDKERTGTGFVVDDGSRIVTTARNVTGSREQFAVAGDGKKYRLELEKLDDILDLAVLKIRNGSIAGAKALELGDTGELDQDTKVWTVSVPQKTESPVPYVSPGYMRGLSSPLELLGTIDPNIMKALRLKLSGVDIMTGMETQAYLSQPLFETKMHVETGSTGSPVLDESGKVIGMTTLSNGTNLPRGQTLASPSDYAKSLLESSGRFNFTYNTRGADWAEQYRSDWQNDKAKALVNTGVTGVIAGLAYKGATRFPLISAGGLGAYGLTRLSSDTQNFLNATEDADKLKFGLAAMSDLGTAGGAALSLLQKARGYGLAIAAAGIAGRAASDFIRNRRVLEETVRTNPEDKRPPFNLDNLLKR